MAGGVEDQNLVGVAVVRGQRGDVTDAALPQRLAFVVGQEEIAFVAEVCF